MKKTDKFLCYIIIGIAIMLCIPSICYLIKNRTVDGFDAYYSYTLTKTTNWAYGLINGIIVIGLILAFSLIYILIIKREDKILKNSKQALKLIIIISVLFMMILPFLSSDIYYYIGDTWLTARYKENPYYTTVEDLQMKGINDEILQNTGVWKGTTSVYGPLWNIISIILVSFSFGKVTVALFIFKFVAFIIHLVNCNLIYKITKSKKYMLLYGLNPLVLLEFLSNVHNDIYLILFLFLALYFLIRKKNIFCTMLFLALSVSLKYSTALIVPFILIYCYKEKIIPKRILYCCISGLSIVGVVVLLYMPFFRDFTIFTNMLVQGTKYSQSIMLLLYKTVTIDFVKNLAPIIIPLYIYFYILFVGEMLFSKKVTLTKIFRKYNFVMLMFIFLVITNFQTWYVLWVLPTIIWQTKNVRKFIMYLTILAIIPSIGYFIVGGNPYTLGITYSLNMLAISGTLVLVEKPIKNKKLLK